MFDYARCLSQSRHSGSELQSACCSRGEGDYWPRWKCQTQTVYAVSYIMFHDISRRWRRFSPEPRRARTCSTRSPRRARFVTRQVLSRPLASRRAVSVQRSMLVVWSSRVFPRRAAPCCGVACHASEGGLIRLEALIELKLFNSSYSSL